MRELCPICECEFELQYAGGWDGEAYGNCSNKDCLLYDSKNTVSAWDNCTGGLRHKEKNEKIMSDM